MAVDILEELYTIKNSVYGSEMRMAIYTALDKVASQPSGGGGSVKTYGMVTPVYAAAVGQAGEVEADDGV